MRFTKIACLLLAVSLPQLAAADSNLFPRPPQLEPEVQFWIKVYTEITTDAGFIHDQHNLSVIYETLHFDPDSTIRERERKVEAERDRFHDMLLRLGRGVPPANDEERHVRALWGDDASPARLAGAADDLRFQLGQADRFRAGLIRASEWESHIAQVLSRLGLPPELAALPHVESSFDPTAYSKVGAAGLWQFMRSTGRRFLRINSTVDERLDPFRETEAAGQLLSYNYRLLGSWPLAITAYNHGAEGVRRARDELGTDDIVRIVHGYHSPSFGFASRNFYVSFLAALAVSQDAEHYFGKLNRGAELEAHELKMPSAASVTTVASALGIERATLQRLNPALRPAVWSGRRTIPAGYVLRVPESAGSWTSQRLAELLEGAPETKVAAIAPRTDSRRAKQLALAAAAPAAEVSTSAATPAPSATASVLFRSPQAATTPYGAPYGAPLREPFREPFGKAFRSPFGGPFGQSPAMATMAASLSLIGTANAATGLTATSQYYLVQPSDTVDSIANRTGVPLGQLMALNSMPDQDDLYAGEPLRLVASAPEIGNPSNPAPTALAQQAVQENNEETTAIANARLTLSAQPVSSQAEEPQLLPGANGPGSQSADPVDYSVAADGSVRVVAAETLGHYADWLGVSAARLRTLNHLHGRKPLVMGRRVVLAFDTVTATQFEQRRREYHERLQAAYFAAHRIVGTDTYMARRGDSLWNITRHDLKVPIWLLQQYNPDLDFTDLKPGTSVVLPKIEDVTGS